MNNFCLLPVQAIIANERGKFHRERRAVKERMLRDVGVQHAAIDLRILSMTNALVSRRVDLAKKQTVQAWEITLGPPCRAARRKKHAINPICSIKAAATA
jgi:hypothetical protein